MNQLIQQLITGLSIGGIYALLAVGYSLIYSIFNFTNFSFGAIMMTSAFAGYFAISKLGLPPVGGVLFALLFGACISLLVEFIAYRPMRKKKAPRLFIMISAYGINMFIINLTLVLLGANLREFPISIGQTAFLVGNISIGKIDIIALIVSLISLLVLWIFLEKTTAGIAIRACSQDSSTAGLMGINGNKVSTMVFAISGVTAAVAGIFFGIKYTVYCKRNRRLGESARRNYRRHPAWCTGDNGIGLYFFNLQRLICIWVYGSYAIVSSKRSHGKDFSG